MPSFLRIATRKSPLALWQSEYVAARLRQIYPDLRIELVPLSTRGDEILDRSLAAIGGKGLFLKELEIAMQRGQADCAVHSLKDVPMELESGFALAAILPRADPADALVSPHFVCIDELPEGARVGTSSLRRQAQLRALRPDLEIMDLRGNINTRLARLDAGDYDAIILAAAGLVRLDLDTRIRQRLTPPDWLPAPAQGALAVECRSDQPGLLQCLSALDDLDTRCCVEAERAMNRALGGSCHVPVGAYAYLHGDQLRLDGVVGSADDGRQVRAGDKAHACAGEMLGEAVARQLMKMGAGEFLLP